MMSSSVAVPTPPPAGDGGDVLVFARGLHFISVQASRPGLLALLCKGQWEPSGPIKTGQLTDMQESCIIHSSFPA